MDGLAIAASLSEVRAAAEGGFLGAIHRPARGTIVLRISAGGKLRVLISPRQATIHLTELTLPNPRQPDPFVMSLRRHVRGGRITAVRQWGLDRVVAFDIDRRIGRRIRRFELVAELTGVRGNLLLLEDGTVIGSAHRDRRNCPGSSYTALRPQPKQDPRQISTEDLASLLDAEDAARALAASVDGVGRHTAEDLLRGLDGLEKIEQAVAVHAALRTVLSHVTDPIGCALPDEDRASFYPLPGAIRTYPRFGQALDAISAAAMPEPYETDRKPIREQIRRSIARRRRTLEKLADWLDTAEGADRLQFLADLLMIHQSDIPPGAETVELLDPATDEAEGIRLLPQLTAIENAQRMYERAKRLRRGRPHVALRIERLEKEVRILETALTAMDEGRPIDDRAAALLPGKPPVPPKALPSLHRVDVDGFAVLIGRNARDNDRLLREAAPNDLWLHAKGFAGSHVIIKRGGRNEIPDAVVRRAARLAAEHSKASGERHVEVVVAEAKHVRKPKGAPPGLANVAQCATLTVAL